MKGKIIACIAILLIGTILTAAFWNRSENPSEDNLVTSDSDNNGIGEIYNESNTESKKSGEDIIASGDDWMNLAAQEDNIYPGAKVITFGSYEQDNDRKNGKEPIEWIVLDEQDDKQLVISKYCLIYNKFGIIPTYTTVYPDGSTSIDKTYIPGVGETMEEREDGWWTVYYEVEDEVVYTWENSEIRNYLNGAFLKNAFTDEEQERIVLSELENPDNPIYGTDGGNSTSDKVFILSLEEAEKYFTADNVNSYLTPYVLRRSWPYSEITLKIIEDNGGRYPSSGFMLRTPGKDIYNVCVLDLESEQMWKDNYIDEYPDIRPAMWIAKE